MTTKSIKILGKATKPNTPKYAWRVVTDPDEIAAIEARKRIEFNKRIAYQTFLQALTFAVGFATCYYVVMPQVVHDAHWNGYGKAYKTYCTGSCLNIQQWRNEIYWQAEAIYKSKQLVSAAQNL